MHGRCGLRKGRIPACIGRVSIALHAQTLQTQRLAMLLECVPNFSEGRDTSTLDAIAAAIRSVPGIHFMGMDSGAVTHRTVMTFAGPPKPVCEAAFRAMACAAERIDMRQHQGTHPRIGATDVCPLIPLRGITRTQAVALAGELAKRVGEELNIPVYLYGYAAPTTEHVHLSSIRRGGYEALAGQASQNDRLPDFGPHHFNARSGATVIGVRNLMIAYNINLEYGRLKLAKTIAAQIRESGKKTKSGQKKGLFKGLKAIGWSLDGEARTQVSTNIMDIKASPIHLVFEKVRQLAQEEGCQVEGSELVGLIPRQPILAAGVYYQERDPTASTNVIEAAIDGLGLNHMKSFIPQRHILEDCLGLAQSLLISESSGPQNEIPEHSLPP